MSLQTNVTTRRQFIGRSALGAGSLLFGPLLLESCTDHIIADPNPNPTPTPPHDPSAEIDVDWNNAAKTAVTTALGMIPEAGAILSALTGIFWPDDQPSVWDQIRDQVEQLVQKDIADSVYGQVSDDLKGLKNLLDLYTEAVYDDNPDHIYTNWAILRGAFVNAQPHFQSSGYEFLLSPLFAQFSNLYLTVLQDPLLPMLDDQGNIILDSNSNPKITGTSWGMTDKELQDVGKHLLDFITAAVNYTTNTFLAQRAIQIQGITYSGDDSEPLKTKLRFGRSVTRTVLDYIDLWPYYDFTKYPLNNKTTVELTREIYSDPYGSIAEGLEFNEITPPWPTQLPTQLQIWGGGPDDRIDAVQLTYPINSGPGGNTQTGWMGSNNTNDGRHQVYQLDLSPDNPIVFASTTYGPGVVSLVFLRYLDQTVTRIGGAKGSGQHDSTGDKFFTTPWKEAMSSLLIHAYDGRYNDADLVIFGTRMWQSPPAALDAVRSHYVHSPKERSAAEFAKAFPKLGITAALITEELKAARLAYWAKLKARAAKLK